MTEQATDKTTELKQLAEAAALGQYLARGEHIRLRAVQSADLQCLAAIMAEAPLYTTKPRPWTTQALRKQFEDEKEPGLWGRDERTYTAVTADGEVVGYIQATLHNRNYEIYCHVDDSRPDRNELGRDMLVIFKMLLTDWHDPPRIEATILAVETAKAGWLQSAGFELEVELAETYMFQGRPAACQIWGWVSPRVEGAERHAEG